MEINGIKIYVLFDIGVGSFYVSIKFINFFNKRFKEIVIKRIDMMFGLLIINVEICLAIFGAVDGKFDMNIEFTKVYKF